MHLKCHYYQIHILLQMGPARSQPQVTKTMARHTRAQNSNNQTMASHQTEGSRPTLASPHDAQQNSGRLSQHAAASSTPGAHQRKSAQLYQTSEENTNGSNPKGTLLTAPLTTGFRLTGCKQQHFTGAQRCLNNLLEGCQLCSYSLGNQTIC